MAEPIVLGIVSIKNMGEYDSQTQYEKLNVVTYQGSTYCALQDTKGNIPTNEEYWQLYAEKGSPGDTGPQGPKPVKGVDYYTNTDKAEIESDLTDTISEMVSESVGALTSATPLAASSISAMTDTTRIYVNATDGHWYWYDGTNWQDGGIYQSTALGDGAVSYKNLDNILKTSYSQTANLVDRYDKIDGKYLNYETGDLIDYANYSVTDYIEVEPNTRYYISNISNDTYFYRNRLLEYDINKDYTNIYYSFNAALLYIETGANTHYVRIAFKTTNWDSLFFTPTDMRVLYDTHKIYLNGDSLAKIAINGESIKSNTLPLDALIDYVRVSDNVYNYNISYIEGKALHLNTGLPSIDNVNYFTSDYFRIKPNTQYISNIYRISLYDKYLNFIKTYSNETEPFTTPTNAFYCRVSDLLTRRLNIQLTEGSTLSSDLFKFTIKGLEPLNYIRSTISDILHNKQNINIKLLGDSITHGVGGTGFNQNGETIITVGGQTWKRNPNGYCWANLLKSELESKYSCTVTNNACTGTSSPFIVSNISTLISDTDDIVICMIGTNNRANQSRYDSLYSDLQTIYEYCKERNIKFIPMASIPASLTDEERENGTFSVRYKHMEDINFIISSFAKNNNLEYIDLFEPFYMYCMIKGITLSSLLSDGLHPNNDGYYLMYRIIMKGLGLVGKISGATW